ncbi:MAG: phosphoribosylanthranilate isomerase [Alphaproteobacteria bacterium]|nr:phosphoribosylanthranilate isomerase [Alphaproteobacteria bacterium]
MSIHSKICGIKTPEALKAATENGARFIGFVFYNPSPRHVEIDIARELAYALPTGVRGVGLFVDPTEEEIERVLSSVQLDMIQLHGDEPPIRVQHLKDRFLMPIIKAIPVRDGTDIEKARDYGAADWILFDTKVDGQHGGTGQSFDWSLLRDKSFEKPWMLSGGLTPDNVAEAIGIASPDAVDVSSGVEAGRGEKDPAKIKAFLEAVNTL